MINVHSNAGTVANKDMETTQMTKDHWPKTNAQLCALHYTPFLVCDAESFLNFSYYSVIYPWGLCLTDRIYNFISPPASFSLFRIYFFGKKILPSFFFFFLLYVLPNPSLEYKPYYPKVSSSHHVLGTVMKWLWGSLPNHCTRSFCMKQVPYLRILAQQIKYRSDYDIGY